MKREIMNKTYGQIAFYDCHAKNLRLRFPGVAGKLLFFPRRFDKHLHGHYAIHRET